SPQPPARATQADVPAYPADRILPVRHQGEVLGALSVSKRPGEALTPTEDRLLTDLAEQVGLVLKNAGLREQLLARLEEIRASRHRLVAALQAQARKAPVPTSVTADGVECYPQDVEAAVYFCVLEALQNVAKYARATRAEVRLEASRHDLRFEVSDDGAGFDPGTK